MKKVFLILSALSLCWIAKSQAFLTIDNEARSSAMATTGVALPASGSSIYNNTSAIALSEYRGAVSYSYSPYIWDFRSGNNLHSVAGYYRLNTRHSITAGVRYFNKSNVQLFDESGTPGNIAKPWDISIDAGYAFKINSMMGLSANVRIIHSNPDVQGLDTGTAFGLDLGYYFRKEGFSAGLVLSNIGSKIDFGGDSYHTPSWLKAGGVYQWAITNEHQLTGAIQFDYNFLPSDESGFEAGIGAEYMYKNLIALRAGYRFADDTMNYNYGTAGLGFYIHGFEVGATYLIAGNDQPLNKTMFITLSFNF